MDIAHHYNIPGIALGIDMEKAYDRVHPQYLRSIFTLFGFPDTLANNLSSLFFNTSLCINVNGYLSTPCH